MHIFRKTTLFTCYPLANFILAQRYVVLETFTTTFQLCSRLYPPSVTQVSLFLVFLLLFYCDVISAFEVENSSWHLIFNFMSSATQVQYVTSPVL